MITNYEMMMLLLAFGTWQLTFIGVLIALVTFLISKRK